MPRSASQGLTRAICGPHGTRREREPGQQRAPQRNEGNAGAIWGIRQNKPTPYNPRGAGGLAAVHRIIRLAVNLLAEGTVAGSILQTPAAQPAADPAPARASSRGLDWFTFFLADIQTGFGPFVAVYLTAKSWTQVDIGLVLTAGGLVALAGQMPGGALVDAVRSPRWVAGLAVAAICMSAFVIAVWPVFLMVIGARALHAAASCVLGPAIAAISLGLAGHAALGERIGRNARFASIGSGVAAAAMGACGYFSRTRRCSF